MGRLRAAAVALAVLAAACAGGGGDGGTAAPATSTTEPASIVDRRPFPVERFETEYADDERSRTLPVVVHHPDGAGPFPVVILSHGLSASGPFLDPIADRLAEAGYVVVAPTFPKTSRGRTEIFDVANQPADVSFLADAVEDDTGRFEGLADTDRLGLAGHSLGAITSLMAGFHTCCADDAVDAVVAYAGAAILAPRGEWFSDPDGPPLLMLHGDADPLVVYSLGRSAYGDADPPKHFVRLLDADHTPPYVGTAPWFDVVINSTVAFFDAHLLDDGDGLARLKSAGAVDSVSEYEEAA